VRLGREAVRVGRFPVVCAYGSYTPAHRFNVRAKPAFWAADEGYSSLHSRGFLGPGRVGQQAIPSAVLLAGLRPVAPITGGVVSPFPLRLRSATGAKASLWVVLSPLPRWGHLLPCQFGLCPKEKPATGFAP